MDSTQDSLTVFSEFSKQLKNVPRGLRVQSGSRFVEEEQKGGLGDQFDTDSESLSLFDVETCMSAMSSLILQLNVPSPGTPTTASA